MCRDMGEPQIPQGLSGQKAHTWLAAPTSESCERPSLLKVRAGQELDRSKAATRGSECLIPRGVQPGAGYPPGRRGRGRDF